VKLSMKWLLRHRQTKGAETDRPFLQMSNPALYSTHCNSGERLITGESDQFMELLEGDWKENAKFTLFKFPTMEHLNGFWNSEEYQAIKHLRTDNTPPNFRLQLMQ